MLTVSADPGNSFVSLRFTNELGGIITGPTTVTLTDLHGFVRTTRLSPFGYARFDNLPTGATFVLQVSNKALGSNTPRVYSTLGSLVLELGVEARAELDVKSDKLR
jgi:hypothetical protein